MCSVDADDGRDMERASGRMLLSEACPGDVDALPHCREAPSTARRLLRTCAEASRLEVRSRRHVGISILVVGASCLCVLVCAHFVYSSVSGAEPLERLPHQRAQSGLYEDSQGDDPCSGEAGVDYATGKDLYVLQGTDSFGICKRQCQQDPRCGAFSWGRNDLWDKSIAGSCFLKQLRDQKDLTKNPNPKVVSGLPCRADWAAPHSEPAPAPAPAVQPADARRYDLSAETRPEWRAFSPAAPDSLYCFALILPGSYEQGLLAWQFQHKAHIFDCDGYQVFSNKSIEVTPGVMTRVVPIDLTAQFGGEFKTALNTDIFVEVWRRVLRDGRFADYLWTVKADADTVFFVPRLRATVRRFSEDDIHGTYINNCEMGLHGPLEVLSRRAVVRWAEGASSCLLFFNNLCSGPCWWGEDMFLDQCFQRKLHVNRQFSKTLLIEDHCAAPAGWRDCKDPEAVAFHPFKKLDEHAACWHTAMKDATTAQTTSTPSTTVSVAPKLAALGQHGDDGSIMCATRKGVDYQTSNFLYAMEGITSSGECAKRCRDDPRCGAWTWGLSKDRWRLTDVCFLKRLSDGEVPSQRVNPDVMSGLACRRADKSTMHALQVDRRHADGAKPRSTDDDSGDAVAKGSEDKGPPVRAASLFCWSLMVPGSFEERLLSWQYEYGAGIFGCDEAAVYSNQSVQVSKNLATGVVNIDLTCRREGASATALNADIFRVVWDRVVSDGRFAHFAWTVKVDPDTIFFPGRLKLLVADYEETDEGVYVNNCKLGLQGPVEVLSRNAVHSWYNGADRCYLHFYQLCSGPCAWGESKFLDQCLGTRLGVTRKNNFHLLTALKCGAAPGWQSCRDPDSVSFHPFKELGAYQTCLQNAEPDLFGGVAAPPAG